MKYIVILLFSMAVFGNIKPKKSTGDCGKVEFLEFVKEDNFNYWKIIEKKSVNNDEYDLSRRIAIVSKEAPEYQRITYSKKSLYDLPAFYLKKDTDIILTTKESFTMLNNIIDSEIINKAKSLNERIMPTSKKQSTKKGWDLLQFKRSNACLIKLKMSIGFFNKNTDSMKLLGDYDDEVIVYHLVW